MNRPADRISGLPVSILSYILSFLPTKDAVATHILAKSWTYVWISVTNLDFSYIGGYKVDTKFGDFVNYVMLLHKPAYLNRLSLTLSEYDESIKAVDVWINTWICSAVANNVCELFVSCKTYKPSIHVQTCMFTSDRLKSLTMKCAICISSEIPVSLPRLEHLKLTWFDFNDGEGFRKLIYGCPVLKYLFVDVSMDHDSKCIISSTSLRHLELYAHCKDISRSVTYAMFHPVAIRLDAPSLEYINLHASGGCYIITFIQASFTCLEEANFRPRLLTRAFSSAVSAVRAFDCARALTLSSSVMEGISSTYPYSDMKISSRFRRLTKLEVTLDWNHWSVLQELMSLSDSLQVLTIKKKVRCITGYLTYSNCWKTPDLVPSCLSNSLKTVSIDAYYGHIDELAMVAYVLKHGSVLQLMQIRFVGSIIDFKAKFEMVQKISKFPRKSLCEVDFC